MFDYEVRRDSEGQVTVSLKGALTLGRGTDRFRACLLALTDRYRMVVLNLEGLDRVDSAGLGELVRTQADASAHGGVVSLVGANTRIKDLLVLCKLITVFGESALPVGTSASSQA